MRCLDFLIAEVHLKMRGVAQRRCQTTMVRSRIPALFWSPLHLGNRPEPVTDWVLTEEWEKLIRRPIVRHRNLLKHRNNTSKDNIKLEL